VKVPILPDGAQSVWLGALRFSAFLAASKGVHYDHGLIKVFKTGK
jgi:hypothetical protein